MKLRVLICAAGWLVVLGWDQVESGALEARMERIVAGRNIHKRAGSRRRQ